MRSRKRWSNARFAVMSPPMIRAGFVPIRKPGKLPSSVHSVAYDLEYGSDALEIHTDAVKPDQRVLLVDDLLATGGTMAAAVQLVRNMNVNLVGVAVLIELAFLQGRDKIDDVDLHAVLEY